MHLLETANGTLSRKQLATMIGVDDRKLRRMIRELRLAGIPVCSNSRRSGYKLATGEELNHMVADYRSRGLACLEVARKIQMRRQLEGQEKWEL